MTHKSYLFMIVGAVVAAGLVGCSQAPQAPKVASSQEAVQVASTKGTVQEKTDYLVTQANAFLASKNYQEALNTAQYVLSNVDKNSSQAKDIITRAQAEIEKVAKQKIDELKGTADKAVNDAAKTLDSWKK